MPFIDESAAHRSLRTAAHVHSNWSDDGSWPLDRIARTFARLGYGVVLMTEHSRGFSPQKWEEYIEAAARASNSRILIVPGIEYGDRDNLVHITVWGELPFFGDGLPTGHLLEASHQTGGTAVWAHPWRREAWRQFDLSWLRFLAAIEVWNRKYNGFAPSREILQLALREEVRLFVGLDFHTRRQIFPLSLKLRLTSPATPHSVYTALQNRQFSAGAFGLPIEMLASGPTRLALGGIESVRRTVAQILR
jgi:hypothetical protein